jgi:hypothetical protein
MVLKKVLIIFLMPKGMIFLANDLDFIINMEKLWMSFGAILICQNPNSKSNVESH